MKIPSHTELLNEIERRFGALDENTRTDILLINEPEYLESLWEDLRLCTALDEVRRNVTYFSGRQFGRADGIRVAIDLVLGDRSDDLAARISEQAFGCFDHEELERMLILAVSSLGKSQVSAN